MKKKLKSLKSLKKKAWDLISIHVRKSYASFNDYAPCFTCLEKHPWKELQCGHYLHNKLDFDLRNLKPQCVRCNHYLRGNLGTYSKNLIILYGLDWIDRLEKDAIKKGNNYSRKEVEEIIEKYGTNNPPKYR